MIEIKNNVGILIHLFFGGEGVKMELRFFFHFSVMETSSMDDESETHSSTPLYVSVAINILSGLLNVFLIVR